MEFQDPRVKEEFIRYVQSCQSPGQTTLTKEFLEVFLGAIIQHEQDPTKCTISLTDASKWVKQTKNNFKRLIDDDYSRKTTGFRKGIDFTYLKVKDSMNRAQDELFMTVETFKQAAAKTETKIGEQVRTYLSLTEKALRNWFGSSVTGKYQRYPYKDIKGVNKIMLASGIKLSSGIGNYTIEFEHKGQAYYYDGITDDIYTRLQQHAVELPVGCDITVIAWTLNDAAELTEKCRETVAKNDKVPVPESLHGMRNLYYKNPALWKEITQKCNAFVDDVAAYHPSQDAKLTLLASPDLYPVRKSKDYPRKKAHNWMDQPVAHYSTDPTTGQVVGSLVHNKKKY